MKKNVFYSFYNFTKMSKAEIELVWEWRNNIKIRQWMYNSEIIPFENHLKFIKSLEKSEDKVYFLVKRHAIPIGVFSIIDIDDKAGEWGYYVAPPYHGESLGVEFYYYALHFIFSTLAFNHITGYALIENKSANSLNDLFGFTRSKINITQEGSSREYVMRALSKETWESHIQNSIKIRKLLELTTLKKLNT